MVFAQSLTVQDWLLGLVEDPAATLRGQRPPPPIFPGSASNPDIPEISPLEELTIEGSRFTLSDEVWRKEL